MEPYEYFEVPPSTDILIVGIYQDWRLTLQSVIWEDEWDTLSPAKAASFSKFIFYLYFNDSY